MIALLIVILFIVACLANDGPEPEDYPVIPPSIPKDGES